MKDLKDYKFAITHAGSFHTDDVIATVFIRCFNPDIKVSRVNDYTDIPSEDTIVYDVGLGEFDHHQQDRRLNDVGIPYSAFGLIFEVYGKEYLKLNGVKNVDKGFNLFKEKYVYKIDDGDNNGYQHIKDFYENTLITTFNANWFEEKENPNANDEQFEKACELGKYLLENWTREVQCKVDNSIFN